MKRLIDVVKSGSIFGIISVDIHTPEHLKDYFSEMTPIFKNTLVSIEDVGEYMKYHLEREGKIKHPQRQLIGNYFAEQVLLGETSKFPHTDHIQTTKSRL